MPYVKRIVCLANSFKQGGACIAGREVVADGYGEWIRPVSARKAGELWLSECLYPNHEFPRLLDLIDVPLLGPASTQHQTENHFIDPSRTWIKAGELRWGEMGNLEERPAGLWIDKDRTRDGLFNCVSTVEAATLTGSLVLIHALDAAIEAVATNWRGSPTIAYWMSFGYHGRRYRLKVTDPDASEAGPRGDVHICVSLTLPFSADGRCHKLVAAILHKR